MRVVTSCISALSAVAILSQDAGSQEWRHTVAIEYPYGANLVLSRAHAMPYLRFPAPLDLSFFIFDTTDSRKPKFDRAQFLGSVNFDMAQFVSNAAFAGAEFLDSVSFVGSVFGSLVDFSGVHFREYLDFSRSEFRGVATFRGAKFERNCVFDGAQLPAFLDLRYVRVGESGVLDLTKGMVDSLRGSLCKIAVYGADVSRIMLLLENVEIAFPAPESTDTHKLRTYEELLRVLKANYPAEGYKYKEWDAKYQELLYLREGNWHLNLFQKLWWNYGHDKYLVFRNALICYLAFSVCTWLWFRRMMSNVYEIKFLSEGHGTAKGWVRLLKSLIYTFVLFFGVSLSIEKFHPVERMNWRDVLLLVYVVSVYIVGLLFTGYIVNIALAG